MKIDWLKVMADLDGTTLTYDCRMQDSRAIVAGFWNMFQNPTTFFELYATVLEKLWGWFTRSNPCRIDDVSKLHATVVSQSCAV